MRPIVIFAVFLVKASVSHAQVFETSNAIDLAIEQSLQRRIGESGGAAYRIDPRLRLARCPAALSVQPVNSASVEVSCTAIGWRIRVPLVDMSASMPGNPIAIKRGDAVQVSLRGAGFEITTSAVALESAAFGSAVRVKSVTDGSVFLATVMGGGVVELRD